MTDAVFKRWVAHTCDTSSDAYKKSEDVIYAAWLHGKKTGLELIGLGLPRHTLSPADTIPHTPCKSCAGTCIGEQDGERLISRCVQCRREA